MSDLTDALKKTDRFFNEDLHALAVVDEMARKYQRILDTDIDEWIEAEAQIAKANGELNWTRVHQWQARNLLAALGITPESIDDVIGADGEPKWMPGDPDDGPILG